MAKITRLSLFIINRAKFRRLVKGKPAERVSLDMKLSRGYVAMMERDYLTTQYNTHEYPNLAQALDWTVEDLLPPDDWDVGDGTKVEKIVLSLANPDDMRLVIEGMIEDGFFNKSKLLPDTVKHLYIDREDKKEERDVLERVLGELVKEGILTEDTHEYAKA